jgi:hypothetical protein
MDMLLGAVAFTAIILAPIAAVVAVRALNSSRLKGREKDPRPDPRPGAAPSKARPGPRVFIPNGPR